MKDDELYTFNDIKNTYDKVSDLLISKDIIKTYSTNKEDIRSKALEGVDISGAVNVLELGCGYGFFIESLRNRLNGNANIIGIDIVENNREAYLQNISAIGYKGEFIQCNVDKITDFDDEKYDLVIASYSLYFFPHLIPQISRILKKNGLFITITHSDLSLQTVIDLIVKSLSLARINVQNQLAITSLFKNFSSQNGYDKLSPYFPNIRMIKYQNNLVFPYENIDDCMNYIEKKRYLIYKEILDSNPNKIDEYNQILYSQVTNYSFFNQGIILNKDDSIFRCWK
jgi:ubiquinone/menaquinone biosynthesis C-methylase UbiE